MFMFWFLLMFLWMLPLFLFLLMLFQGFIQLFFVQGGRLKGPAPHPMSQSQLHGQLYVLLANLCPFIEGRNGLGRSGDDNLGPVRLDSQVDAGRCNGSQEIIVQGHIL